MKVASSVRFLHFLSGIALSPLLLLVWIAPSEAQNQPQRSLIQVPKLENTGQPNRLRPSRLDSSLLSLAGGQRLMGEAEAAINGQNYTQAIAKLQQARQIFNQLSNFYQELGGSFSGIETQLADELRRQASNTAEMRDQATYQLAVAHRSQSQPELAIPLLVQVIRSQNPTRDLGKKAYQQLFEVGFATSAYPASASQATASTNLENNLLSLAGGERLLSEANTAMNGKDYTQAIAKLQQARQVLNQLSNFYQELAVSFSGIETQIADELRRQAINTAEMRDQATYQLAVVHRTRSQPELSVPLLIQIVRSQNPTRELGKKAYQQLFELGFVTSAYPASTSQPTASTSVENNLLSLAGGQRLMGEANAAMNGKDYTQAIAKLQQARQVLNQLSNFYQELTASFSIINIRLANGLRRQAIDTAEMRDQATYQLAVVHRTQNQPELSVPLLIQIVRSQNPTRELGKKAYQQLFELGFVTSAYPASASQATASSSLENNLLSLAGGQRLMGEANAAINGQNYTQAIAKLQQSRQVFNQLSNFYQELAASFSGIDTQIADGLRRQAINTAEMRDQATYQLALVHRAQSQPEVAVPLLVQIIRSQNPTRKLGKKAYQQLFELGFVAAPFSRPRSGSASSNR